MPFTNRKNILSAAKGAIVQEMNSRLESLNKARIDLIESLGPDWQENAELIKVNKQIEMLTKEMNDWHSSKRSKQKKSIEWKDENTQREMRSKSSSRKEVNWEAAREVKETRESIKTNNSSWLQEGTLAVHKDDKTQPMVVIEIGERTSKVLLGGLMKSVRTLSLRPAFDD